MLAGCGPSTDSAPARAGGAPAADQVVKDFTIDAYVGGALDWRLKSPRADIYEKENLIRVDTPSVRFYEADQPGTALDAGRGEVFSDTKDLRAWEGVVMVSTDGARLASDWLRYDAAARLVVSTAPVTIVRKGATIEGVGWEATPDMAEVRIFQQKVEIEGKPPARKTRARSRR